MTQPSCSTYHANSLRAKLFSVNKKRLPEHVVLCRDSSFSSLKYPKKNLQNAFQTDFVDNLCPLSTSLAVSRNNHGIGRLELQPLQG